MIALFTDDLRAKLQENGRRHHSVKGTRDELDFVPVVRLFTPLANSVWLLTKIDPKDADRAFGLHDPGNGSPELGYVSLTELEGRFGHLSVRWDESFQTNEPLSVHAKRSAARER